MSHNIHLAAELQACRGWRRREDLWDAIQIAIGDFGFIPLQNRMIELGGGKRARPVATDDAAWFDGICEARNDWDERDFHRLKPQERFATFLRAPVGKGWETHDAVSGLTEVMLFANRYGDAYSVIE